MPTDTSLLKAALIGYESEKARIEQAIAEIRSKLGGSVSSGTPTRRGRPAKNQTVGERTMSAAAKKRIAEAQRKRWAAWRKSKAAA